MKLNQPYYIDRRNGYRHAELDGAWDFFWSDEEVESFFNQSWPYRATLPNSVFRCLHEAGVLPDPYVGTNSKQYHWVDQKIWYFRKMFTVDTDQRDSHAYLCFDGVAYYSRVWLNGALLGNHEGMFGGPVCDVAEHLIFGGQNELVVEIKACTYGIQGGYDGRNNRGEKTQIVPWNIAKDTESSTGDFSVLGLWNRVRLEFVNKYHISRPYIYTKSIESDRAELYLEFELFDGRNAELKPYSGYTEPGFLNPNDMGITGRCIDDTVDVHITVNDPETGKTVYEATDREALLDYSGTLIRKHFVTKSFFIESPKLWYPIGLGDPFLYECSIELYHNGVLCDKLTRNIGIRTFEARPTTGRKYHYRWKNYLFCVNGKEFFLKGINWQPVDYLYGIDPKEYKWALDLAKNAGVQMLRVWSGGGMPETDTFYDLCDKLGILVWQDHMLANQYNSTTYPQHILESQEAYNIYRIRSHPSLVIHCGGNENNPYHPQNAAAMFVISRLLGYLDPTREYYYTSPDAGSAHIYRDMEPVWYRHIYQELPFLAESGIHSFPSFHSLKQLVCKEEYEAKLPDLASRDFAEGFPELMNHFTEYNPARIPQMLSRASQITNIRNCNLEVLCEATQIQAYEWYTVMVQAMEENYPACGGILPWVFKRPWATVGIQVVDGMGQPSYPYYAIRNTYQNLSICFCEQWSILKPREEIPLTLKIFNRSEEDLTNAIVTLTVYDPTLQPDAEYSCAYDGRTEYRFAPFTLSEKYTDHCFLICVELTRGGEVLARTTYYPKCTSLYTDPALFERHRAAPVGNLYFHNGPWLIEDLKAARKADVATEITPIEITPEGYRVYRITVKNTSDTPAYPVTVDVRNTTCRFYLDDNFFLLKPGEVKTVMLTCDKLGLDETADITIRYDNK